MLRSVRVDTHSITVRVARISVWLIDFYIVRVYGNVGYTFTSAFFRLFSRNTAVLFRILLVFLPVPRPKLLDVMKQCIFLVLCIAFTVCMWLR